MAHIVDITREINGVEYKAEIEFDYFYELGGPVFHLMALEIRDGFLRYDVSFLIPGAREEIINQLKNKEW